MISDKKLLNMQFEIKILKLDGNEFQKFVGDILRLKYPNFQPFVPYKEDGGNDGYVKDDGIYFQMYGAVDPGAKQTEANAASKLKRDFYNVYKNWNNHVEIKEYNFVYNNKDYGSTVKLEKAIIELKSEYPEIKFKLFDFNKLQKIFNELSSSDHESLGFDLDTSRTNHIINLLLEHIKHKLNENELEYAKKNLELLSSFPDLSDEIKEKKEILNYKYLVAIEKQAEAEQLLIDLTEKYPEQGTAFLKLAIAKFDKGRLEEGEKFLNQASKLPNIEESWLYNFAKKYEQVAKNIELNEDFFTVPDKCNDEQKADFYNLFSFYYVRINDYKAITYINQARQFNRLNISFQIKKLDILLTLARKNYSNNNTQEDLASQMEELITEILKKFPKRSTRNNLLINYNKYFLCWIHSKKNTAN